MPRSMVEVAGRYNYTLANDIVLGSGTHGIVYRGHCIDTGVDVAIKELTDNDQIEEEELEIVNGLDSAFIVKVVDVAYNDTNTYIVMELCDTSLDDHLTALKNNAKTMHPDNLDTVLSCIADGYNVLYNKSIVHRDIKPQNILLQYHPTAMLGAERKILAAKLTDFGSSRIREKRFTNLCGTPLYMAPEIGANMLHSSQYNCQVDMWAIGCTIYECINLDVAFNEKSLCRLFLQASCSSDNLTNCGYQAPTLRVDQTRDTFYDELITRLLDIDPTQRIAPDHFYRAVCDRQVPKTFVGGKMPLAKSEGDLLKHHCRGAVTRVSAHESPQNRCSWAEYAWRALQLLEDYMITSNFNNVTFATQGVVLSRAS